MTHDPADDFDHPRHFRPDILLKSARLYTGWMQIAIFGVRLIR